jgi:hypothetical protein
MKKLHADGMELFVIRGLMVIGYCVFSLSITVNFNSSMNV